ncbi:MAG: sialidase family protein [FCB group bacterium]|jgi:predicted neuraminidase|nr:sialidase family protein [FCB group bacterium]
MLSSVIILVLSLMPGMMQGEAAPAPAAAPEPAPAAAAPAPEPAAPAPAPAPAPGPAPDTAKSPEEFQKRVTAYGGAVDFVFTEPETLVKALKGASNKGRGVVRWLSSSGPLGCFTSSLTETKGANLLCAFSAGSQEASGDKAIWLARYSERDGWERYEQVAKISDMPHWSPVLFRDPKNAIYLFFKVGADVPSWQTYWISSEDAGRSWSKAEELVPGDRGGRGPSRNKPVILTEDTWLAPASIERGDRNPGAWQAFADRSDDLGKTWVRSDNFPLDPAAVPGAGVLQPAFWESAPNEVHALMRTSGGFVGRSDSHDGGKTWTPVVSSNLANNNSPVDVLRLEDGRLLLVFNPARKDGGSQTPLTLAMSTDNGATWANVAHLEGEAGTITSPCIIRTRGGLAVSYTWNSQRIRCWQIPLQVLDLP